MESEKSGWRLIVFHALIISIVINLVSILLGLLVWTLNLFSNEQVRIIEEFVWGFALTSPLLTFFIGGAFVYFFRGNRKIRWALTAAILGFSFSLAILATITNYAFDNFYEVHRRTIWCGPDECGY